MASGSFSGELIVIGKIRRVIGLAGKCVVETFGITLNYLKPPANIWLGKSESAVSDCTLSKIQKQSDKVICAFEGVDNREQAERLRGYYLFVERKTLPELPDNEYYHFELKGMSVFSDSDENNSTGIVQEVYNYPTIDAIEVKRADNSTLLIPLGADSVVRIDRVSGKIIVRRSFIEELM
jgi:16S rRNA processing protein RimM